MTRKASVQLELDLGMFTPKAATAKADVHGIDSEVEGLDRDLNKIPADATKAAAAMKLLGGDVSGIGTKLTTIGDKSNALTVLNAKIRATGKEVRQLGDEFTRTGSVDVWERLGKSSSSLQSLKMLRTQLTRAVEGGASDGMLSGLLGGFKSLPGSTFAKIALPVGAALVVPLLASIGGALSALTGGGVAGIGVLGAVLGNPGAFKAAWTEAINIVEKTFSRATAAFTRPTLDAIGRIGPLVASWHLDTIFANAVKFMQPLTRGIEGFATGVIRGIGSLVEKGGPAVDALSQGMIQLGMAIGDAFGMIASGAEGGAQAFHDLLKLVTLAIESFGALVMSAEKLYKFITDHPIASAIISGGLTIPITAIQQFDDGGKVIARRLDAVTVAADGTAQGVAKTAQDFELLSKVMNTTAQTADTLAGAMVGKLFSATMGLDQATLSWHQSLTAVTKAITLKNHSIDISSEKGQANIAMIYAAANANMAQYQATLSVTGSAQLATDAYNANTQALEAQLRKAGMTQSAIDGLIGKYRDIPKKVDTNIAIMGLTTAINELNTTLRLINGLHDKTVTARVITIHETRNVSSQGVVSGGVPRTGGFALGGIRTAATGLLVPPSNPGTVLFGEPQTGGEAFIPLRGISRAMAMDLSQVVGDAYGFEVSPRWRAMGSGGYTPTSRGSDGVAMSGFRLDPRVLGQAIRVALAGMNVMLDGQRVGQVQGQQSDLIRRGG